MVAFFYIFRYACPMKKVIFGIDGGGTRSRLALMDKHGTTLARVEAGSINKYSVDVEQVYENLHFLFVEAFAKAQIDKNAVLAGCLGGAGMAQGEALIMVQTFFKKFLGPGIPVKLCTDAEILLCGGLDGLEGYCLIAGTGSVAMGRGADGRLVRAGGNGYLLGDEGGAAWIGKSAIARAIRSGEGRDLETGLYEKLLNATGKQDTPGLVNYVHSEADKADVARLAPIVTEAARQGDLLALDILRTGGRELALLVESVMNRSPWIGNKTLVTAGGVLEHDEIVRDELNRQIAEKLPNLACHEPKKSALDGACMLAQTLVSTEAGAD
jgi:N-acetylglucosamine kinase-like BadF-type ATPase